MSWSYSPDQINTKPLMRVRLEIGDNICQEPQFQDEEINAVIASSGSLFSACAVLCRSLATKYSRSIDFAVTGGGRATYSQLSKQYMRQAVLFEAKAASSGMATPYFGGVSIADKINNELNTDRVTPAFQRGMQDNLTPVAPTGLESEVGGD